MEFYRSICNLPKALLISGALSGTLLAAFLLYMRNERKSRLFQEFFEEKKISQNELEKKAVSKFTIKKNKKKKKKYSEDEDKIDRMLSKYLEKYGLYSKVITNMFKLLLPYYNKTNKDWIISMPHIFPSKRLMITGCDHKIIFMMALAIIFDNPKKSSIINLKKRWGKWYQVNKSD